MKLTKLLFSTIVSIALLAACDEENIDNSLPTGEYQLTTVDASAYEWVYFSFSTGDTVSVATPDDSQAWDIAFQRLDFKTNSGTSGSADGGAYMSDITVIDEEFTFDESNIIVDDSIQMFVYGFGGATVTNAPGSVILTGVKDQNAYYTTEGAWSVSGENQNRAYTANDEVFVIKCADGKYAKVQFLSYYSLEDGKTSAHISFNYIK